MAANVMNISPRAAVAGRRVRFIGVAVLALVALSLYFSAGYTLASIDQEVRIKKNAVTMTEKLITMNAVLKQDRKYYEPFKNNTRGNLEYGISVAIWPVPYVLQPAGFYILYYTIGGKFIDLVTYFL